MLTLDPKKKSFAIAALRRASYRWPGRYLASKASHVGRNQYKCAKCGGIFKKKETNMDHLNPVINPVVGWIGFDNYIERLFAEQSGWQRLCKEKCHSRKTKSENKVRTKYRRKKKEDK